MTVLPKNPDHRSSHLQQDLHFSAHRRYDGSYPIQSRTDRYPSSGILRQDILKLTALLLFILFAALLLIDLSTLYSGRAKIGKLSARIESLSSNNALLQQDLILAMDHPVLRRANMDEEGEETVITLTAALP